MCGTYGITALIAHGLEDRFNLSLKDLQFPDMIDAQYFPFSVVPTVSRNSPNKAVMRIWSLMPPWIKTPKELKYSTFNARAESLREKSTYKNSWEQAKRCLIPASYFLEFKAVVVDGKTKKIPYEFRVKGEEVFSLAGLYEDSHPTESCTIITTEAGPQMKEYHTREAVVILKKDEDKWLSKDTPIEEAFKLLHAMKDGGFAIHRRENTPTALKSK